jgi:hypothetical protein
MDGLREVSKRGFENRFISSSKLRLEVVEIKYSNSHDSTPQLVGDTISPSSLKSFAEDDPSSTDVATFKLIHCLRSLNDVIQLSREDFTLALKSCGIDPYVLYMLGRSYSGFYHFEPQPDKPTLSFLLRFGWTAHAPVVIWSYHIETLSTKAIVVSSASQWGKDLYERFSEILTRHKYLSKHPLFLGFVATMSESLFVDRYLQDQSKTLNSLQRKTGLDQYYENEQALSKVKMDLDVYSNLSREMNRLLQDLVQVSDLSGHIDELLDKLVDPNPRWRDIISGNGSLAMDPVVERSNKSIVEVSGILKQRQKAVRAGVKILDSRARNELNIVSDSLPS